MAAKINNIGACVFDAYGTLFDVAAAAGQCRDALAGKAAQLTVIWRTKQLEYTWLRSLMGEYIEFWKLTGDGLDYAMAALGIKDKKLRERLMDIYMRLDAYPEVKGMLTTLKKAGIKTAILSNGSPKMLKSAVNNAGIGALLDDVISVDTLRIYKPHPRVYQLGVKSLKVKAGRICFMSSNAWDAAAAANFGFRVVWVNRFGQPKELLPGKPEHEIKTLKALPPLLGL
jgi:2-haloacid dehalogenase